MPVLLARAAACLKICGGGDTSEQGFIDAFQHFWIADSADQYPAFPLHLEHLHGGSIGKDDPAAGDVIRFVAGDNHDGIGDGAQHLLKAWAFGLNLDLLLRHLHGLDPLLGVTNLDEELEHRIGNNEKGNIDEKWPKWRVHRHDNKRHRSNYGTERNNIPD